MRPLKFQFEITVSYDTAKGRVERSFTDQYRAKSFYVGKFKEGKNPKITKGKATHGNQDIQ